MELRPLGSTDIAVSPLGLGTVKFGRNRQVKYPRDFELPSDTAIRELLAVARDCGINILDTAPAYGSAEQRLGALLDRRDEWVIVNKVGERFKDGRSSFDFSAAATRASVERSLRLLRREVLDVVLVHSDGDDRRIIEQEPVWDTLARLKQDGLIRAYGMSTKTVEGGLWVVEHCDVVMATYNLAETAERPVLDAAARQHKGVLIKKGLQSGHADSAAGGAGVEQALRFVLGQAGVSSVIVGTINPDHLRSNVRAAEQALAATEHG